MEGLPDYTQSLIFIKHFSGLLWAELINVPKPAQVLEDRIVETPGRG